MGIRRNDVAIYLPTTAGFYDRRMRRAQGAERQMMLLARAFTEGEYRVAQIVYPVADPIPLPNPRLTLVERRGRQIGDQPFVGAIREAIETWRVLSLADADVVVLRTRTAALAVAALFCRLRSRRLIFSSAERLRISARPLLGRSSSSGVLQLWCATRRCGGRPVGRGS